MILWWEWSNWCGAPYLALCRKTLHSISTVNFSQKDEDIFFAPNVGHPYVCIDNLAISKIVCTTYCLSTTTSPMTTTTTFQRFTLKSAFKDIKKKVNCASPLRFLLVSDRKTQAEHMMKTPFIIHRSDLFTLIISFISLLYKGLWVMWTPAIMSNRSMAQPCLDMSENRPVGVNTHSSDDEAAAFLQNSVPTWGRCGGLIWLVVLF